MKKHQDNIQERDTATDVKTLCSHGLKGHMCCTFFAMIAAVTIFCLPVFAASDPCNGEHSYKMYYNDCVGDWIWTDYCENCGYMRPPHPCLQPLRFMTVGATYAYSEPQTSSTSKLLTNNARHNVNVVGRIRNRDAELWLLLDDGSYIMADSVAFNFDYYAESAVNSVSNWIIKEPGMLVTFINKKYNPKNDNLLGNTYRYKLYSSGVFLSERYTGEQIGNMVYGYAGAAKGFSYSSAAKCADLESKEGSDTPEDKYSILLGYNYRKNGAWFEEVSSRYIGKTIAIKSIEVGKYVSSNTDQDIKGINAVANRDSAGTLELFTVKAGKAGTVGFLSKGNGNYLSARIDENKEYAYIQAAFGHDYSEPQSWESFRIFEWNGIQYIQSQENGKWVQVSVNESDYPIKAAADAPSTWERFQLETVEDYIASDNTVSSATEGSTGAFAGRDYFEGNNSASTTVSQYYWGSDYNEGWYEGEWSNGKPNGYGKLTYDDFEDGNFYSFSLGDKVYKALYYEGYFRDGWRYGTGKVVYEDGWKEEGTYYGAWAAEKIVFEGTFWHKDGIQYLEGYLKTKSSTEAEGWKWSTDTWQSTTKAY